MKGIGVCVGLCAGVVLGVLFAPRAGSKTRSLVRNAANDGVAYVKRRSDEMRDGTIELVKETTDKMIREREGVKAAVIAGKRAYERVATS